MRLVRRASLRKPDWWLEDGPPVVTPSGLVVGGMDGVSNFDLNTFRPTWSVAEEMTLVGSAGRVVVGDAYQVDDPSAYLDDLRANPWVRRPRTLVALDAETGQSIWRRKIAWGPWVIGETLAALAWNSEEVQLLDPATGEPRQSLRGLAHEGSPFPRLVGFWESLAIFIRSGHGRAYEDPFFAVDVASGTVVWERRLGADACRMSSLSKWTTLGLVAGLIILTADSWVLAFASESGEHVWSQQLPGQLRADGILQGLVVASGPPPPGVAWLEPSSGAVTCVPQNSAISGEDCDTLGTYRGRIVCAGTPERLYLVDPTTGSVSRHKIPRTDAEVAVECGAFLCLLEGGRRVLVLEGVDDAAEPAVATDGART